MAARPGRRSPARPTPRAARTASAGGPKDPGPPVPAVPSPPCGQTLVRDDGDGVTRNAREEAFERLGGRYEVRVLEPSPPAVDEAPWFADDPVARGEVPEGRQVVSPVATGDLRWDNLARDD